MKPTCVALSLASAVVVYCSPPDVVGLRAVEITQPNEEEPSNLPVVNNARSCGT